MAFNLSTLATKESTTVHLRHPATDELLFDEIKEADGSVTSLPVTIDIYGPSSSVFRNLILEMSDRQAKRGKTKLSAEANRKEGIALLAACSIKAHNFAIDDEGTVVDSEAAFKKLYSDPTFAWVKEQVDSAMGDYGNFLEK